MLHIKMFTGSTQNYGVSRTYKSLHIMAHTEIVNAYMVH